MKISKTSSVALRSVMTIVSVLILGVGFIGVFENISKVHAANPTFPVSPPVAVNTATGSQLLPTFQQSSCTYQNYFYVFWIDPATDFLFYSSSTDGLTWIAPVNALTLTSMGTVATTTTVADMPFQLACNGAAVVVLWSTVNAGATWAGQTNFIKYATGSLSGGSITFGSVTTGPKTSNGNTYHAGTFATAAAYGCLGWLNTHVFYCVNSFATGGQWSMFRDNNGVQNNTFTSGTNLNTIWYNGIYMVYQPAACNTYSSGDGVTWTSASTISATFCTTSRMFVGSLTGYSGTFYVMTIKNAVGTYLISLSNSGAVLSTTLLTSTAPAAGQSLVTTDGNGNFVAIGCSGALASVCNYFVTNNAWTTFTSNTVAFTGNDLGSSNNFWSISTAPLFSSIMEAFSVTTVTTSSTFYVYATVFGIPPSSSSSTQTQTIGSCPTKNTATFTMVNNTIYMYYGNALGSEVVNTVQTSVASITGSGSHTLKMLVYVSSGQSASVSTPLVLAYQQSIVISSGTTNNVITFQVNIPLNTAVANPLPFNLWGVGIVGDNKIKINQSSLSGLFTQTGSASTANQPASFTSQGTSVGTMLYLCATASYQSVLPAVTTTSTLAASTTVTASTTTTATISTIGATLFTTSSNWPVIFLILLLPAGLFLGVTKTIAGAILGLVVGSVIGELMGILPTFVFVGLVISLIAVAFVARNREGG